MIRFGVIGTNWITEEFIRAAKEDERFQLKAVYSRSADKAEAFANQFGAEYTFTNLAMMAESDVIDAVYIASPNSLHAEQSILFLKHHKHVLCEKAIASNVKELTEMLKVAEENGVVLMEALKSTLVPNFQVITDQLGKIGQVRRMFASYCQYSSRYNSYRNGTILNAFNPTFSNGALMDIGVYCIYPTVVLFGKPLSVKASGVLLGSGVDGEGSVLLTYKDMDAVLMYSKITNSALPWEIQGEDGNILIDKVNVPEQVRVHIREEGVEEVTISQDHPPMFYEAREFMDVIERGETQSAVNSWQHSLWTMEIMDEVRRQVGVEFPADKKDE